MKRTTKPAGALARRQQALEARGPGRPSATDLIRRLPNAVLVPGLILVFGALIADLAIADPLPLVDEATMLWGLVQGLRVLGERRRAKRGRADPEEEEPEVVAEILPDGTPVPVTSR